MHDKSSANLRNCWKAWNP